MNSCSKPGGEEQHHPVDATDNRFAVIDEHLPDSEGVLADETPAEKFAEVSNSPGLEAVAGNTEADLRKQLADHPTAKPALGLKASVPAQKRNTKATLGKLLQKHRHALGLTQRELSLQLCVKPAHVAYLETDRRRPSLGLLSRIATVLGIDREKVFALTHTEASSLMASCSSKGKHAVAKDQAWKEFRYNKALLARHQVRPRELQVLAQVNLLGKVTAPRNFLFILNAIRHAVDEED